MEHLLRSIRSSLATGNHHGALALALALPDICGWLREPAAGSQARYVRWFDDFLATRYIFEIGPWRDRTVFLTGADLYALRCAYLHQGGDDISQQRAAEVLEVFNFTVSPGRGTVVHLQRTPTALQIQVDKFCGEIIEAVETFLVQAATNADLQARIATLARVRHPGGNVVD
jgi:hypothetical protein